MTTWRHFANWIRPKRCWACGLHFIGNGAGLVEFGWTCRWCREFVELGPMLRELIAGVDEMLGTTKKGAK